MKKLLLGEETVEHDKDLFQFVDRALQSGVPERKATLEVRRKYNTYDQTLPRPKSYCSLLFDIDILFK